MCLVLVTTLLFSRLPCPFFFMHERGCFNRFSSSSYGYIVLFFYTFLSHSFFSLSLFIFFFALFAREVLFSISRLLPDVGNGGNGCIWYFYNHGYERHLLSTSQPYRANVNDSQLLCASRRCYR